MERRSVGRTLALRLAPLVALGAAGVVLAILQNESEPSGTAPTTTTVSSTIAPTVEAATLAELDAAIRPMAQAFADLLRQRAEWVAGTISSNDYAALVKTVRPDIEQARANVAAVEGPDPRAIDLYSSALGLYLAVLDIDVSATGVPDDALRLQLDRASQRVRLLADRVYDAARRRLAGPPDTTASSVLALGAEVPDWVEHGLAAGEPLAPTPPDPPPEGLGAHEPRPTGPLAEWEAAVLATPIPHATTLRAALVGADSAALRALGVEFEAATHDLGLVPDPADDPDRATLSRLALLLYADAARVRLAATSIEGDASATLADVAVRLAVAGDAAWDPSLPPRTSN